MFGLTVRLAFAGLGSRRVQGALTIIVVAVATAALTMASGVGRVADRPFERTFAATNGAHVVARTLPGSREDLRLLAAQPGVTASTGVLPVLFTSFDRGNKRYGLQLVGVGSSPPAVARPLIVEGAWPRAGEVLLEQSFASFHKLAPGARVELGARRAPVRVSGIAVLTVREPYPRTQPGLAVARVPTLLSVEPDATRHAHVLGVRIDRPDQADRIAAATQQRLPGARIESWRWARDDALAASRSTRVILSFYGGFLLVAGCAVLATLVGGRVVAQQREVALLKTVGLTPRQVGGVFLLEQLALALAGCAIGVALGTMATPLFTSRAASLLAASETPPFDPRSTALLATGVLAVVALAALAPALVAGRRPVASVLHGATRRTGRRSRLGRMVDALGLPPAASLGARGSFARPGRSALSVLSLALCVAAVVATLGMEASLDVATTPPPSPPLAEGLETPAWDPVDDDAGEGATIRPVVYALDGLLLFVALCNLLATLLLTVRDRVRELGLLKAIGLTPRQLTGSVVWSQALLATLAALVGIPLGLGLFRIGIGLSGSTDEFAYPAAWSLLLLAPVAVGCVLAVTLPIARRAAALPVADAVRYE